MPAFQLSKGEVELINDALDEHYATADDFAFDETEQEVRNRCEHLNQIRDAIIALCRDPVDVPAKVDADRQVRDKFTP